MNESGLEFTWTKDMMNALLKLYKLEYASMELQKQKQQDDNLYSVVFSCAVFDARSPLTSQRTFHLLASGR